MIHDSWHNSAIGKGWDNTRISIINDFKKLDIPESQTSYFLDSVEELTLAGGTAGLGAIAKAALKTAKRFQHTLKEKILDFQSSMTFISSQRPVVKILMNILLQLVKPAKE